MVQQEVKEITPPMKFNVGLMKYEPDMSVLDKKEEDNRIDARWILVLIALIVLYLIISYWFF
jgi:hypothetical protein